MKTVQVRNVVLGSGAPKICVPLVGVTKEDLLKEVSNLKHLDFDLVEWRVDFFELVENTSKVEEMAVTLRQELGETPILFTFRSKKEGGERELAEALYFDLIHHMVKTKIIDLVDVELFMTEASVKETVKLANEFGVKVVMCNHDFDKTPAKVEIVHRLRLMQDFGADVCKIALMPQSSEDVLTVLQATNEMYTKYADRPIVTMSMGGKGMISRLSGEIFGSAMTFGAATKASAPGQVPVGELRDVLDLVHRSL